MKRKLLITLILALALAFSISAVTAFAAESDPKWSAVGDGVTVEGNADRVTVTGKAGEAVVLSYAEQVNFNEGAYMQFVIPKAADTTIDKDARVNNANYIRVTALNAQKVGVEFVIYARYSAVATQVNKMDVDVFYIDPSVKADADAYSTDGKRYLETFEIYQNVEDTFHIVDIHKENGLDGEMWFFAFDGLTAIPVPELNGMDLSAADVQFEYFSRDNTPSFMLDSFKTGINKHYIENNLLQFGSDKIEKLPDDTVRYKIADKRAAQYPGQEIRYREHLISATGYDVNKPITIAYSYDVSNASAVWYAVGLGRPNVLNSINRLKYDVFGEEKDKVIESYSDSIASKNDGIMFQTTKGMAQPTEPSQNSRLESYITNSASKPYEGRQNMDLITFIVHDDGTDIYHNGKLLFTDLVTKKEDFKDNGYKAYPYFHFFEDSASVEKGNTIVVNGFNVPQLTDENQSYKIKGGSGSDLVVGVDSAENGTIRLLEPDGENGVKEADPSMYAYDAENGKLTIKYAWFEGKEYDVYKLYARNNDGSAEITVRFSDPALVTEAPTVEKDNYEWPTGSGTEDLVIRVDIHNGIWKSFSGGGIMSNNYTVEQQENSTVYVITIQKEFLNNKKSGSYTFTVRTTDAEEGSYSCQFKVTVAEPGSGGDNNGDNSGGDTEKGGCGSSLASASALLGALVLTGAAFLFVRKKV